ncbi:hypothetical protein D5F01_LYC17353 [Larimichthys crocea]|uniref:Uncharacterized protein n=1 Tax=Larimichthys crocea TaxID=215358 RepID=A0A6G0HYI0_LARCR|nr:hypothetical protein D5F01_LYC17353 [Larimichthys crocea]
MRFKFELTSVKDYSAWIIWMEDRKIGDSSESVSSNTKQKEKYEDNGSEQTYTRRGLRNKVAEPVERADDEPASEKEATTQLKTDTVLSSVKTSSYSRLLETDDTEEPKVDEKPEDSSKKTSKMSLFKDLEGTDDGSSSSRHRRANDRVKCHLMSSDEEESSSSLSKTDINKVMEEKETADEPSWKEKCESAAAVEEKPPSLQSDRALPLSKNRDASPPPSPPCQAASLQRQDSGPRGIKGILKKSRSTSVESDHSEGSTPECAPARQSNVTLSHPESEEEAEEGRGKRRWRKRRRRWKRKRKRRRRPTGKMKERTSP